MTPSPMIGVRLRPDDYEELKEYAERRHGKSLSDALRHLVVAARANGLLSDDDDLGLSQAENAAAYWSGKRRRNLGEDLAVARSIYNHAIDEMIATAEVDWRRAVLAYSGVGQALQESAEQLANAQGTTVAALMGGES